DTVSAHIQDQPPWLMMYADDIALIAENRLTLERKVNLWKGHWCGLRPQNTAQAQGADIQEHRPTGSFIRQRMLASTISAHSGASRHGNEDAEVDVRRNAV
ncbi:unnamed protein product, partial [Litomosoides sigmodontis]